MKIEDYGDEESHFWIVKDESGKILASGRDKSKVIREATNQAKESTKHIAPIHFGPFGSEGMFEARK